MSPRQNRSLEPDPSLPFSRPFLADDVPDDGTDESIAASAAECAAVAAEIGLPAVDALVATYRITRLAGGRLQVGGEVRARITQTCVVSLEPFDNEITQPVEMMFAPAAPVLPERAARLARSGPDQKASRRRAETREAPATLPPPAAVGEDDPPDPIVDGRIDLGTVAVEFLTLALDFYPRKPGVAFHDVVEGETDMQPSPFAALERIKDRT